MSSNKVRLCTWFCVHFYTYLHFQSFLSKSSFLVALFIIEILNKFLGVTFLLRSLQRLPVYQSKSKYSFIFWPSSTLQFLKINILSNNQGKDHWPLMKPCSYVTFPLTCGLSPVFHSCIHTSTNFGVCPVVGITMNLRQNLSKSNDTDPTWGTQIPSHFKLFFLMNPVET